MKIYSFVCRNSPAVHHLYYYFTWSRMASTDLSHYLVACRTLLSTLLWHTSSLLHHLSRNTSSPFKWPQASLAIGRKREESFVCTFHSPIGNPKNRFTVANIVLVWCALGRRSVKIVVDLSSATKVHVCPVRSDKLFFHSAHSTLAFLPALGLCVCMYVCVVDARRRKAAWKTTSPPAAGHGFVSSLKQAVPYESNP